MRPRVTAPPVGPVDVALALRTTGGLPSAVPAGASAVPGPDDGPLGDEGYALTRVDGVTVVLADAPAGLLYGLFHLVRLGEAAFAGDRAGRGRTGRRCAGGCSTTGTTWTCTR